MTWQLEFECFALIYMIHRIGKKTRAQPSIDQILLHPRLSTTHAPLRVDTERGKYKWKEKRGEGRPGEILDEARYAIISQAIPMADLNLPEHVSFVLLLKNNIGGKIMTSGGGQGRKTVCAGGWNTVRRPSKSAVEIGFPVCCYFFPNLHAPLSLLPSSLDVWLKRHGLSVVILTGAAPFKSRGRC